MEHSLEINQPISLWFGLYSWSINATPFINLVQILTNDCRTEHGGVPFYWHIQRQPNRKLFRRTVKMMTTYVLNIWSLACTHDSNTRESKRWILHTETCMIRPSDMSSFLLKRYRVCSFPWLKSMHDRHRRTALHVVRCCHLCNSLGLKSSDLKCNNYLKKTFRRMRSTRFRKKKWSKLNHEGLV